MAGRYVLGRRLAIGGMAEIFAARVHGAGGFEKDVVVKKVLPAFAGDAGFRERFFQEARLAALLSHPHIVQVYELVEQDGDTLLAMEAVQGADIATLLRLQRASGKALPLPCALWIAACVADALAYAHDKTGSDGAPLGIVHRDVTPSNVLVSTDGVPKLIDFGIAKAAASSSSAPRTQAGLVLGKAWYLSPEQCLGRPVDGKSDVFALGIVLFQMLAGRVPFGGRNGVAAMDKIATGRRPALSTLVPGVPQAVVQVVDAALLLDRAQRPTAKELRAQLERALALVDPERRARDELVELIRDALVREAARVLVGGPAPVVGVPASSPTLLLMDLSMANADVDADDDIVGAPDTRDTGEVAPDATLKVEPVSLPPVPRTAVTVDAGKRGLVAAAVVAAVGAAVAVALVLFVRGRQADERRADVAPPPVVPTAMELRRPDAPPIDDVVEPGGDEVAPPDEPEAAAPVRKPKRVDQRVTRSAPTQADARRDVKSNAASAKVTGTGVITFHADPWAQVWLGGKSLGMTWTGPLDVPAGRHTLLLKNPVTGHEKTVVVDVKPSSRQSLYVTLEKRKAR